MYSPKIRIYGDYVHRKYVYLVKKMIHRLLHSTLTGKLQQGKAILLVGPRQTGKTTLIKAIWEENQQQSLFLNCDDPAVISALSEASLSSLKQVVGDKKLVFIDEAQRVKNIGLTLKLIHDNLNVQLVVSGSSSFDLANEINEPLTGRKWEYQLLPISWKELNNHFGFLDANNQLKTRVIYGMYPDVINHIGQEREVLQELAGSYLYKDLLQFEGIRKPDLIDKILRTLAFQIGSEVSYNEIANLVQTDKNTVIKYVNLFEKAFIIFQLPSFRRNLRSEIGTKKKVYFYDNGIRNALIGNFNQFDLRNDVGSLWENFLVSERMKVNLYERTFAQKYFWRTVRQQEIDYVEEVDGSLKAFEFKWNVKKKARIPAVFSEAYPEATLKVITPENFNEFLMKDESKQSGERPD